MKKKKNKLKKIEKKECKCNCSKFGVSMIPQQTKNQSAERIHLANKRSKQQQQRVYRFKL